MRADAAAITRAALAVAALSFCSSWTSWSWSWSWRWLRWCCCNNISIAAAAGPVPYEGFVLEFLAELMRPRKNGDEGQDEEAGEHDVEEDDRKGWCCDCACDPLPFKFDRATPLLRICSERRDASALLRSWFMAGRYSSDSGWRIAVNYLSYSVLISTKLL